MIFLNDLFFLLPELFWIFSIIGFLLFSTVFTNKFRKILIVKLGYFYLYLIALFGVLISCVPVADFNLLNYQYSHDSFTFTFKLLFLVFLSVCIYLSFEYFFFEKVFFIEYYFLVGFFCISSFFLVSSNDFMLFYLSIELQALILYTLASLKRYNVFSAESGLKYFVLGAFSSGLLLFGISLFYGFFGIFTFYDIKFIFLKWLGVNFLYGINMAVIFIFAALLFKLAAAPFHIWVPDVYEGAPTIVVLLFASLPKLAVFAFLIRFYISFLHEIVGLWYVIFFFAGLLSVLWGTFGALNQVNIKRLYAYSAIVNVGYLLTSLAYGTLESLVVAINYLVVYLLSTLSLFLVILAFRELSGYRKIKFIGEYSLYLTYSSLAAILFSLIFFSMAGVPPLAGFFIKFFLFKIVFLADFLLSPVVFIILLTSVVSTLYYIRVVRFVFFDSKLTPIMLLTLNIGSAFLLVFSLVIIVLFVIFQPLALTCVTNILELAFL